MSDRLIARVARSKHPALEQYFVRDVLQAFAERVNARRERAAGDRCVWATIQTIADDCERAESRVREAVRILDAAHGTDAVTRVLVGSTNGDADWTTIGVHENVIAASWMALEDALAYGLFKAGRTGK